MTIALAPASLANCNPKMATPPVLKQLRAHLDAEGFPDVAITFLGGNPAGRTDPDDPFLALVCETAKPVYGTPMQIVPMIGGSGPNFAFLQELKIPVATGGFGDPDTRAHAPDESFRVDYYLKHAKHVARLIHAFA